MRYTKVESGQSEILGLILLLSLTLLTVGVILSFGGPAITEGTELSESGQIENEFALLDSRMATSALGSSEVQNVEMNLRGGALESQPEGATMRLFHNFSETDVIATNSTLGGDTFQKNLADPYNVVCAPNCNIEQGDPDGHIEDQIQPALNRTLVEVDIGKIEYTRNDEMIAYEGGAVWKKNVDENQSVMISPPEFHYALRGQTLTIPQFNVTSNVSVASTADTNVRVGTTTEPEQLFDENPILGGVVKAEVESEYYRAWASYFDQRTEGSIDEENIDDENQTALVELEVPFDQELDGGQAFQGGVGGTHPDSWWADSDPGENEFFLSASEYVESVLDGDDDNEDTDCVADDGSELSDGCGTIAPSDDQVYHLENDPDIDGPIQFDISEANVTIAVDGEFSLSGGDHIEINDRSDNTRVEMLAQRNDGEVSFDGGVDVNAGGNSSDFVLMAHSNIGDVDINGAGNSNKNMTTYAPNSVITSNGFGNAEYEGAIIGESFDGNGNQNEPISDGSPANLDLGGASDTITYLQVTENEVTVDAR